MLLESFDGTVPRRAAVRRIALQQIFFDQSIFEKALHAADRDRLGRERNEQPINPQLQSIDPPLQPISRQT
jgi:hypothetical protein